MNVFGAFTFGGLIKTFIPGFVWLGALLLAWRALRLFLPEIPEPALPDSGTGQQNALVLAIPVAILLGLLSNIMVFMGINDAVVRRPARRADPQLFILHDWLVGQLRSEYWGTLDCADAGLETTFGRHADAELLMLQTLGVENLAYVREQYWFHMEFQVNLAFALAVMLAAVLAPLFIPGQLVPPDFSAAAYLALGLGLPLFALCWLLVRAARKNYLRHVAKMSSVIAAAICAARKEAAAPSRPA